MKTPISFRLRKDVDADIIAAVAGIDSKRIAELARDGLRLMLGIKTTRHVTIVEKPLEQRSIVEQRSDVDVPMVASKTVFKPLVTIKNNGRGV